MKQPEMKTSSTPGRAPRLSVIAGLCALASLLPLPAAEQPAVPAKEALKKLEEGNARFVAGKSTEHHEDKDWRDSLVDGQRPFAVVISCSDSRVPTELVFDQGFGDLFVIRNAGNMIATDVLGSIEYAIVHLGCKLVLVMGHESCGAVTAALMSEEDRAKEPPEVQAVLKDIIKDLEKAELPAGEKERVAAGVKANVRCSVKHLKDLIRKRNPEGGHGVEVAGAVYDLHDGKVNFQK